MQQKGRAGKKGGEGVVVRQRRHSVRVMNIAHYTICDRPTLK